MAEPVFETDFVGADLMGEIINGPKAGGILRVERMVIHLQGFWNPLNLKSIKQESQSRSFLGENRVFIARRLGNGLQSVGLVDPGRGGFRH